MADKPPYVPSIGPRSANIVLVGEAPGASEEKARVPFVGYSGQILRNTLSRVGIPESEVFITNTCHYRPPGNNISRWFTKRGKILVPNDLILEGVQELYRDLAEINPTVIVPMGNTALWALCGVQAISKRRGSILPVSWDLSRARVFQDQGALTHAFLDDVAAVQGCKVIPTFHPSYVLRKMEHLAVFQTDLTRIRDDAGFRELRIPEREIIIDPPEDQLGELVRRLLGAPYLCYDIECVGYGLYCVGFASEPGWALTLTATKPTYLLAIRELCGSPQPKIAQNGIFDLTYLAMHSGIHVENFAHDTLVAQHAAYPSLPKGLDFLCSVYTREPYYKDEGKNWNQKDAEDVHRFLTYNAKDVCATLEVHLAQIKNELEDPGYRITYDRVFEQMPIYAEQMIRGIRLDLRAVAEFLAKYEEDWALFQEELDKAAMSHLAALFKQAKETGQDRRALMIEKFIRDQLPGMGTQKGAINVNSYKNLGIFLYDILGLKEKKKKNAYGKAVRTTDEDALKEVFNESGNPLCLTCVKIRQTRKRISSYLQTKTDGNGVTHFSVSPVKAKTGRSSYGTTITGEGLNMQTVPHELRKIYVPDV